MKCGKCSTPILPGEDYCRICGTKCEKTPTAAVEGLAAPVVEEVPVAPVAAPVVEELVAEPQPSSVIEEPVVETLTPPVVKEPKVEELAVETLASPVMESPVVEELVTETLTAPVVEEPIVEEISEPIATPVMETLVAETVEEVVEEPKVEAVNPVVEVKEDLGEVAKTFELAKELDLNSAPASEPTPAIEEPKEEELKEVKPKKEKNKKEVDSEKSIEEIIAKNNKKPNVAFIITFILLIISLALNVALFLGRDKESNNPDVSDNGMSLKTIYYKNYAMNVDYNWVYTEEDELVFNDKSENWGASLQVINADYQVFVENKDDFNNILSNYALEMSSKEEKVINDKTLYRFSGKYNNYITDVIIADLGNNELLKVQLLYKGERDDIVLNKTYELMTSMVPYNTTLLNDTTFKFEKLEAAVLENSVSKVANEAEESTEA